MTAAGVMTSAAAPEAAAMLSYAAEVLGTDDLRKPARAADVLPGTVSQLERAAGRASQL
jgi:hypothetical protein